MDNDAINEDSIDTEALQAQIDMSMAFAENLVSSWLKPSRKLPAKSKRDMEAELQEYMRRPPRLGVGAAIPETQSLSRETMRLKGQLIGKSSKRAREEDAVSKEKSDDEEESRAGAIKKKARVDPFGEGRKKKKNKKHIEVANTVTSTTPNHTMANHKFTKIEKFEQEEVIETIAKQDGEEGKSFAPSTPRRKKSKRKSLAEDPTEPAQASGGTTTTEDKQTKNAAATSPKPSRVVDMSLIETPIISSRFQRSSQSVDVLKQPLLNLTPQSEDESDEPIKVESPVDGSNHKKKRKRKKKKKTAQATVTDA